MKSPCLRITASRLTRNGFQIAYGRKIIGTAPDVATIAVEVGKLLYKLGILAGVRFQVEFMGSSEPPILGRVNEPPLKPAPSASPGQPTARVRGWRDADLPVYRGEEPEYQQHTWH